MCCVHDEKPVPLTAEERRVLFRTRERMVRAYQADTARMARLRQMAAEVAYLAVREQAWKRWAVGIEADWVGQDTLTGLVIEQPTKVEAPADKKELVLA